ncbi:unnamed protein product, partial [Pylaiella littoralis]
LCQVVTDYTDVNTENSSVCVYVRARPPDPSWTVQDDDASVEEIFQNPLQATLAGLSPKSASGGLSPTPHATSSAFITNFPDNPKKICIKDPAAQGAVKHHGEIYFSFDRVFWTECSQEEIFQAVAKPQVENILNGFNGCCFAYGQTGSGKTYSMFGQGAGNSRGMIPRCMEEVFAQLDKKAKDKEIAVVVSFLEIYCDRVRDLGQAFISHEERNVRGLRSTSDVHQQMKLSRAESFQPRNKHGSAHSGVGNNSGVGDSYLSMDLKIHEDVQGNVFVKASETRDLSLIPVTTLDEVLDIINLGLKVRATHETKMNQVSSRSHTVFTATVVQRDPCTDETMTGVLNLVDLAGSERLKKSASEGQRKIEALHINSSLTALGKVVMALDPSSGSTHVPYRDSKLTRLLQNSLGGNSFTVVLATVHPIARLRLGNGGLGGDGPGGASAEANSRVLAVLAQMGLEGSMQLPNGSIRLPDGRIVGNFGLDAEGSGGDASNSTAGGVGGRAAYTSVILRGVPPNVRTMVQGLEGEVRGVKKKLKERKKELVSIQGQLEARRAVFVKSEKESKRREAELEGKLAVAEAQLYEVEAAAARTKEEQLKAVVAGSQALLRRQRRLLLEATGHSAGGGPEREADARAQGARERREGEARHAQSLRALQFSKEVETENLKQKYEQLMQAEALGRAFTEAKLEKFKTRRDREVQELSAELLLLHGHASSLHDIIHSAGLASSSSLDAIPNPGGGAANPTATAAAAATARTSTSVRSPPNKSSAPATRGLLLQSASLPRLSRLLEARGAAAPAAPASSLSSHNLDVCHGLPCSRSEAVLIQDSGSRSGEDDDDCRLRPGQTTESPPPRARPRSAGVARSWSENTSPSPSSALGLVPEAGTGTGRGGPVPAARTGNSVAKESRNVRRGGGRIRPVSAPGRRPLAAGGKPGGRHTFVKPGQVDAGGGGRQTATASEQRMQFGGWSAQDVLGRNAGELSRGGLLYLVRALRETIHGDKGVMNKEDVHLHAQEMSRPSRAGSEGRGASLIYTARGPEEVPLEQGGRPDTQKTLLREQTRRYNDLRVAYESLYRRLERDR